MLSNASFVLPRGDCPEETELHTSTQRHRCALALRHGVGVNRGQLEGWAGDREEEQVCV